MVDQTAAPVEASVEHKPTDLEKVRKALSRRAAYDVKTLSHRADVSPSTVRTELFTLVFGGEAREVEDARYVLEKS